MNKITDLKGNIIYQGMSKDVIFNQIKSNICYLCGNVLSDNFNIDHIIAKSLLFKK